MAVIDPGNLAPHAMLRVRGVAYTRYWRGLWVVQKWPEKSGPPKTWNQYYTSQQFRYAGKMSANPEPMSLATAIFFTEGSHYLPRDVLTMAAYGKFIEVTLPDGTVAQQAYHGPPAIAPPAEWLPLTVATLPATQATLGNLTWRQLVASSAITNAGLGQSRVTLDAPASGIDLTIAQAAIQEGATTGNPYGYAGTPVPLLFGGAPNVTIPAGTSIVSDPVAFAPAPGANLVVGLFISAANVFAKNDTQPGWSNWYQFGNDVATVAATGYTNWTAAATVRQVETAI